MPKSHKLQERPNEFKSKVTNASVNRSEGPFWTDPSQGHFLMEKK